MISENKENIEAKLLISSGGQRTGIEPPTPQPRSTTELSGTWHNKNHRALPSTSVAPAFSRGAGNQQATHSKYSNPAPLTASYPFSLPTPQGRPMLCRIRSSASLLFLAVTGALARKPQLAPHPPLRPIFPPQSRHRVNSTPSTPSTAQSRPRINRLPHSDAQGRHFTHLVERRLCRNLYQERRRRSPLRRSKAMAFAEATTRASRRSLSVAKAARSAPSTFNDQKLYDALVDSFFHA